MNEDIKELALQAGFVLNDKHDIDMEKFAELIVKECMQQCQQEWYDTNNDPTMNAETDPRMIGIKIGIKQGAIKCKARLSKHFGIAAIPTNN